MAIYSKKKDGISDPGQYNALITDRKKRVRRDPHNAKEWVELGRLHEAKKDLATYIAGRNVGIRYCFPLYILFILLTLIVSNRFIINLLLLPWQSIFIIYVLVVIIIALSIGLYSLRYPSSGKRYFKKAISIDPDCGEAFMYLGMVCLRRYQKRKGCRLLEQAIRLEVCNSQIERELKSIYEKEFMAFFKKRGEKEIRQQEIIESQLKEITQLRSKVSSFEKLTESLNGRVDQAKWESSSVAKSLKKEMKNRISFIQEKYEEKISALKRIGESQQKEAGELAEKNFVRLTTEIMEAKAVLEDSSLKDAARSVREIIGKSFYMSLSEQVRSYLATAEHIYVVLNRQKDKPDYGLVGMELCKALENEINRVLVEPFVRYLNGNGMAFLKVNQTGEVKGKPTYFTYLAKVVDNEKYPEVTTLTLGQYYFVLKRTLEGEYALRKYVNFLDKVGDEVEADIGRTFLKKLKIVTRKYRNTIAHHSPMNRKQYEHLRDLILAGNEALLITCCKVVMKVPYYHTNQTGYVNPERSQLVIIS